MSELRLESRADGVVLTVRAVPGASRDRVVGVLGQALKIAVVSPPEKGKANDRLVELLTASLGRPARSVCLLSGASSRDKRLLVTEISAAELHKRIDAHLSS